MAELPVAAYDRAWAIGERPPGRIRAIQCGKMALHDRRGPSGVSIPIVGYLVDAPGGRFVVDTGLGQRWRDTPVEEVAEDGLGPGVRYRPRLQGPTMAESAAAEGFLPDRLVCTHLHLDHVGGARALGLPVEAAAAEVAVAEVGARGYPPEDIEGLDFRAIELDYSRPVGPFPASAELADGVLALDTSGHSPGSISLFLCIGQAWVLVCGDAAYPLMEEEDSPAFLGMLRIRRYLEDMRGLVLAGHDTSVLRACRDGAWLGGHAPH